MKYHGKALLKLHVRSQSWKDHVDVHYQALWYTSVTLVLVRLRQEDGEFKAVLGYVVRPSPRNRRQTLKRSQGFALPG